MGVATLASVVLAVLAFTLIGRGTRVPETVPAAPAPVLVPAG
ncbi:hypothetical protein [Blastococcus sp. CCUG 61487]|nr:hypothetical protein [Blastococcus sp. CCUG 61487]